MAQTETGTFILTRQACNCISAFAILAFTHENLRRGYMNQHISTLLLWATVNGWFIWVAGHSGVEKNERADSLSRRRSISIFSGPELSFGILPNHGNTGIANWTLWRFQSEWTCRSNCRLGFFKRACLHQSRLST